MKKLMLLALGAVMLAFLSGTPVAQAQSGDAISLVNQAIMELTDFPALGDRYKVDLMKIGGADVRQMKKATALLQDALSKGGGNAASTRLLQEAIDYGMASEHKEARLSAQGALYHLCQGGGGAGCDTVPKYGSYAAP